MMTFLQELGDLWWFIGIILFLVASWFALKWADRRDRRREDGE